MDVCCCLVFFFSSRRRHTRSLRDWSSDVCSSDLADGTFEDVSVKAGVNDPEKYYGFSSAFVHVNDDKLLDLIVVNDSTPKQLYINRSEERRVGKECRSRWSQ